MTDAPESRSPLDRAALTLARHAALADAVPSPAEVVAPPSGLVLVVRRPSHLPEALHRLAELVDTARHLTPRGAQLIAGVCAETAHTAANVLHAGSHAGAATTLAHHAELLGVAATSGRRTASITPADPRPLAQAQQIHHKLLDIRRGLTFELRDAWRAGGALPAVAQALDSAARREVRRGTWLVPSEAAESMTPGWTPARLVEADIRLAARLGEAAGQAPEVMRFLAVHPATSSATARTTAPSATLKSMPSSVQRTTPQPCRKR